jgi:excisionase family DNA binding protein
VTDGLLDVDQAAAFFGVPKKTVYAKTAAREWPFTKIGRHIRFSQEHLDAIVAAGEQPVIQPSAGLRLLGRSGRVA